MKKRISLLAICLLLISINAFAADGDLKVNGSLSIGAGNSTYGSFVLADPQAIGYVVLGVFQAIPYTPSVELSMFSVSGVAHGFIDAYGSGGYRNILISAYGGNVGIGTTNPGIYKLNVAGPTYCTSDYWSGSDVRWKKNVEPISNALSLVQNLRGVRYEWDTEKTGSKASDASGNASLSVPFEEGKQIGLVAQDVEKILPEVVMTNTDGYKAISYDKLTAVLIEAVKELKTEVEKLKAYKQYNGDNK